MTYAIATANDDAAATVAHAAIIPLVDADSTLAANLAFGVADPVLLMMLLILLLLILLPMMQHLLQSSMKNASALEDPMILASALNEGYDLLAVPIVPTSEAAIHQIPVA